MIKIIFIIVLVTPFMAITGPLDIKKIKKQCLKEYLVENSEEYSKCVKDKVYKELNYSSDKT
mgnify:CR=1 FL=1